jgi:DNA-binding NtrC family response regulator
VDRTVKHICFADDDPDDHLIFSVIMRDAFPSINIDFFYDCTALLNHLSDKNKRLPDVIFLDLNMPGNDGNGCLRLLKSSAAFLNIPVVIYSTSDFYRDITQSFQYGAYRYIVKPSSFTQLENELKEIFEDIETIKTGTRLNNGI